MQDKATLVREIIRSEKTKRILIIHSATLVFNSTLKLLREEFPNAHITVLTNKTKPESLEKNSMVDSVISLAFKGHIGVFRCGRNLIHKLRLQSFDLAVSLYNVERGVGYSNIDLLAWCTKPGKIRGYNSKGTYISLSGKIIFQKMVREKMSTIWMFLNITTTVALFICITGGVLIEILFRKIFQRKKINQFSN